MEATVTNIDVPKLNISIEMTREEYTQLSHAFYETRWGECSPSSRNFMVQLENLIRSKAPTEWNLSAWINNADKRNKRVKEY